MQMKLEEETQIAEREREGPKWTPGDGVRREGRQSHWNTVILREDEGKKVKGSVRVRQAPKIVPATSCWWIAGCSQWWT